MKNLAITLILVLSVAIAPAPALAQTDTGPTPGSFWYGITTTFENINLFFTFNAEKKAEKALSYAEKRLAQATSAAENENTEAVEVALADYETKINLASESSKKIKDDERAEKLFTSIADNTTKHQEVLSEVLEKVPDEARQAIAKAIEASKRGQEEAMKQVAELKGEVEQLKKDIAELKQNDSDEQATEVEKLRKEVEELKKKTAPVVSTPKPSVPPTVSNKAEPKPQVQAPTPAPIETWGELEARFFVSANDKGWTSQTITNALGEKRYYRKENNIWVQKNSEAEIKQPFTPPPTSEELNAYNKVCREVPDFCKDPKAYSAYLTNLSFRELTNDLIRKYNVEMSSQAQIRAQQANSAQKQQLECLMAITPEGERTLSPATQDYLRKLRCGTATSVDRTNYELSQISSKISDLEYRLKNNQTFSPSLINEIPPPSSTDKWRVQWTGDGRGFITNTSGVTTYFHCENSSCSSY